jgi:AraC family transcriptional regulator
MIVDAELRVPTATAQLVRFHAKARADEVMHERATYWVDQCLTPRPHNARARYHNRWGEHRFERLGSVFLVPPGETMQVRGDGGSAQASIICHLAPEPLGKCFDGELMWTDHRLEACLNIRDANIRNLLQRLAREMRGPSFSSEVLSELIVTQLAVELCRYCTAVSEAEVGGALEPWRLRRIDERLKEIERSPTLAELAELCKLSVRHLARRFRASRGCSIGDYIADIRFDQAKRLLAGDHSVKAVAYLLGFSSASSFCYAFRRATLETPAQWCKSIASEPRHSST